MIRRLLTAVMGLAGTTGLHAQSSPILATAAVTTPLAVTATNALDFGLVFQGVNRNIQFNNASSGRFAISGSGNAQLALTFLLPTTLSNGAVTMPISNYNVRVNDTNTTASANAIAVTSGTPVTRNLTSGQLYVFIGARVSAAPTQAFGTYTGSLVLSAAYTGL